VHPFHQRVLQSQIAHQILEVDPSKKDLEVDLSKKDLEVDPSKTPRQFSRMFQREQDLKVVLPMRFHLLLSQARQQAKLK
jgi:hypothetical protein